MKTPHTLCACSCFVFLCAAASVASAQRISRISVGSGGIQGDAESYSSSMSAHGRYVAFYSDASNLVPGDTNGTGDVFLRDRLLGTTIRVSVDSSGAQGNDESQYSSISADGRFVAFMSRASNLVAGDNNGSDDVFVRDVLLGATELISVDSSGQIGDDNSYGPDISADGRYVVYGSYATNLVPGDTNGASDIFLRDRVTGATTRVSVGSSGAQADLGAHWAYCSDDGRQIVFDSISTNLVAGDTNGFADAFVRDLATGTTTRVNVDSNGAQANSGVTYPTISGNGRYVTFGSPATNLVAVDTNDDWDVFVHDRLSGITTLVSVSSAGAQGNQFSSRATLSADGRYVAFKSTARNLVQGDGNGVQDIFVRDMVRGLTVRVSVASNGAQADDYSSEPILSADGHHVAFYSAATNLVPGDTNGEWDVFVRSFTRFQ
jgi:hypothetical protein